MISSKDFHIFKAGKHILTFNVNTLQLYRVNKNSNFAIFLKSLQSGKIDLLTPIQYRRLETFIEKIIKKNTDKNSKKTKQLLQQKNSFQNVILPVSGHCNLNCPYCFAQTKHGFGFDDISFEQSDNIVDFIIENSNKNIPCSINFFGGEPILRFDVIQHIVKYIEKKYPERKISYGITTNGTLLNKHIIDFIKEKQIGVLLSFDGPKYLAPHRIYKNGRHSFDVVIRNIKLCVENKIKIQLRATISGDCKDIVGVYEFLESLRNCLNLTKFIYK
jgi:sulfatase maturation enzyme AslB (radical SAM superfamily)